MIRVVSSVCRVLLLICMAAALHSGCSVDRALELPAQPLDRFEIARAEAGGEWRDARRVGGDGPIAIDLGTAGGGDAVRFGFFDPPEEIGGSVRMYAGDRRIYREKFDARGFWRDERLDLDVPAGTPLRLVIDADRPIWVGPCEVIHPVDTPPPNVLVLLIDTLRQDHMSVYGYERDTTPVLRAFAEDATLLTQLVPSSSWTRPSVASLFTSMHPNYHGAQTNRDNLREGLPSLAASLGAAGYDTQGLMSNANCVPTWGFGGDFARYVYVDTYMKQQWDDDTIAADLAIASIDRLRGRPWFLYVHFMSPHKIYNPPEPFKSKFAEDLSQFGMAERQRRSMINLYDGEIARSDFEFGRILDALRATGQYDNTMIVVLSDHGEEFQEHGGWEHGRTLYEEVLRVPLLIKPPNAAWSVPDRIESIVEMVDIAPTILEVAGVPAPERFQGRSILPQLRGEPAEPRTGFAALNLGWFSLRAAKTPEHKYIRDAANDTQSWFDLAEDPRERSPLDTPAEWGAALADRVTAELVGGAAGLHVMLVADGAPQDATVTIECPACGEPSVSSHEWRNELTRDGGTIAWTFFAGQVKPIPPSERPNQASWRVHARMNATVPPDQPLTIQVRMNGEPVDPERVFAGADRKHLALDGGPMVPFDLLAHPDAFDLATVPTGVGVYLWYVASPESLTDAEVPQEIREQLEALGYAL